MNKLFLLKAKKFLETYGCFWLFVYITSYKPYLFGCYSSKLSLKIILLNISFLDLAIILVTS